MKGKEATRGRAADTRRMNVDFPAFGNPTRPTSASSLSSRRSQRSSPLSPGSARRFSSNFRVERSEPRRKRAETRRKRTKPRRKSPRSAVRPPSPWTAVRLVKLLVISSNIPLVPRKKMLLVIEKLLVNNGYYIDIYRGLVGRGGVAPPNPPRKISGRGYQKKRRV